MYCPRQLPSLPRPKFSPASTGTLHYNCCIDCGTSPEYLGCTLVRINETLGCVPVAIVAVQEQ
jgi:hypothetical protein